MSLRARILAGSAAIALVLVVAAFVIARITEAHLIERIDTQLEMRSPSLEGGAGNVLVQRGAAITGGPLPEPEVSTEESPEPGDPAGPTGQDSQSGGQARQETRVYEGLNSYFVGHVTTSGVELVVQPDGDTPVPAIDRDQALAAAANGETFTTGSENSDTRFRVTAFTHEVTGEVMVLSQSLADVDAIVGRLVAVEAVAILAVLGALGLVAWWVDRHGIRPVERMTETASAIAAGDLSHRVPQVDYGTEAGRLGSALNQMLARIEQAFDQRSRSEGRLRQFVADASHELRTPVTTIRGYSELYESGGLEEQGELSEAMRRTRQEAVRMGDLVDDMLLLARLDEGRPLDQSQVDVAALAEDAGRDARAVDPERDVVIGVEGPLEVMGDGDRLRQVLANLVGNALVHTPSTAAVEIRAGRDGDDAVVEVVDQGPGMPAEVLDQAFDRFYRADPSRSRHRGGSGLGLAIVQAAVAAHGGEVTLESTTGDGTTARVVLPLAPDDDAETN